MDKKGRKELKDRFMNLVVDDKREKITVKDLTATAMMIRNSPPDYSVLLNFIEKEIEKAREEAFTKEEWSVIANKFGLCCEERGYYEGDRELERRLDELSKLKQ